MPPSNRPTSAQPPTNPTAPQQESERLLLQLATMLSAARTRQEQGYK